MRYTLARACLWISVCSFITIISIWIYAIWFDIDSYDIAAKLSATAFVLGGASGIGYIFLHEKSSDNDLKDKDLLN